MSCTIPAEIIAQTKAFHGHSCPGLAIGIRAAELAIREMGNPADVEMVAVSETDMCGVDAIQFITGCTFGKGNFLHRDYGKMAFSFYDRKTGKGVRALLKPEARSGPEDQSGPEGKKEHFMTLDLDDMFTITKLDVGLPRPAKILESLVCAQCGESVMESRTRRFAGETLCIPCFARVEQKC